MKQYGNYFFIRIANKAGKIDRYYNFILVSRIDQRATILWAVAKGKKIRIANCNEGVERERKDQWRRGKSVEKLRKISPKKKRNGGKGKGRPQVEIKRKEERGKKRGSEKNGTLLL